MTNTIADDPAAGRLDLLVDGERVGEIGYAHLDDGLHLTHTEILPEKRQPGLASEFVTIALRLPARVDERAHRARLPVHRALAELARRV